MIYKTLALLSLFFVSGESKRILDFNYFSLEAPDHWVSISQQGIDSFVGGIAIGKGDTLHFDYGNYSWKLDESLDFYISNDSVYIPQKNEDKNDTIHRYVNKFYRLTKDIDWESLKKQYIFYENISDKKAKISVPKKIGNGFTGVYFENVSTKYKNKRLAIYGSDLGPENHRAFLEAIKTIKFKVLD